MTISHHRYASSRKPHQSKITPPCMLTCSRRVTVAWTKWTCYLRDQRDNCLKHTITAAHLNTPIDSHHQTVKPTTHESNRPPCPPTQRKKRPAAVRSSPPSHHTITLTQQADIYDQVAKESSDSTASTHSNHDTSTNATSGGVASFEHHKANPGPAISQNIGEPASKDELKKRAEELNK